MRADSELLFCKYSVHDLLGEQQKKMCEAIVALEENQLLRTSAEDLCNYLEQEFTIDVPKLRENETTVDQSEAQVDVSQDRMRDIRDRTRPFFVRGTAIKFHVPFTGNAELFRCQPSTFSLNPPRGIINPSEIVLTYTRLDHNAEAIKHEFDSDLSQIRTHLERLEKEFSSYNLSIRATISGRIEQRREKILKDQGLAASLGFPLRRRDDLPQTYIAPQVRRKLLFPKPTAITEPSSLEPTLDLKEYEHILTVISNMVAVIERSPQAFKGMKEEDLRNHFLVQLNGHYEGQATGETFNFEGKTDILIRVEGKNIFIAECKIWRGPKLMLEAIDQLLGYASWRDTKTALLIFNRQKELSKVLAQIPETIKAHPNFIRQLLYQSETGFRFILHHRDDRSREIIMSILAFEVPE